MTIWNNCLLTMQIKMIKHIPNSDEKSVHALGVLQYTLRKMTGL